MRTTMADALTAPVESPAVTIMLDQSMPADEGGKSRLANVVDALNARLQALPPNSAVGLWTLRRRRGPLGGDVRARCPNRSTASRARRR